MTWRWDIRLTHKHTFKVLQRHVEMFAVFLAQSATWNTWKFLSLSQTLLLPSSGVKWCNTPDYCKSEGPNNETSWLIAAPVVMFRCKVIICRHLVIDPGDPVSESDPNCFLTCLWIRKLKRHFLHIYVDFFFFYWLSGLPEYYDPKFP